MDSRYECSTSIFVIFPVRLHKIPYAFVDFNKNTLAVFQKKDTTWTLDHNSFHFVLHLPNKHPAKTKRPGDFFSEEASSC